MATHVGKNSMMPLLNLIKKFSKKRNSQAFDNDGHKKSIYSEREFFEIIERERERANRNNHHFSLIVLELDLPSTDYDKTRYFLEKIIRRVRIIDEVGWYGSKRVGIILPYTNANGAQEFSDSLDDLFASSMPISLCTIYTYPSDRQPSNL